MDYRYFGDHADFSEIHMEITLSRQSSNFIWQVISPLIVLVLLMWAVFWLDVDNLSERLNLALIGVLTIVAYQFLIDGTMPRISSRHTVYPPNTCWCRLMSDVSIDSILRR